jgi:hypothetical protein
VPFAYNRKEAKDHGEGGTLVGAPLKGRVLIVDDVMSAGTAARESIALIKAAGATPHAVAIALDRQEKATENGVARTCATSTAPCIVRARPAAGLHIGLQVQVRVLLTAFAFAQAPGRDVTASLARSKSLTCCGFALPLLAFMTWPTSALKALSLPARNWATLSALAAITSSMIFSSAPESFICLRPLASMMASTSAGLARPQRIKHLLGCVVGDGAVGNARNQAAS